MENKALILDFLEWVAREPRPYVDVMDAWRTSCPRFPVWEDAVDRGLVSCVSDNSAGMVVSVTAVGRALLAAERCR